MFKVINIKWIIHELDRRKGGGIGDVDGDDVFQLNDGEGQEEITSGKSPREPIFSDTLQIL